MAEESAPLVGERGEDRYGSTAGSSNGRRGGEEPPFGFAKPGVLPHSGEAKTSRDGSVHLTDEARAPLAAAAPRTPAGRAAQRREWQHPTPARPARASRAFPHARRP